MTPIDSLLKKLRDQPKTVDAHRREQLEDWKSDLEKLCAHVEEWLKPASKEGLLKIERVTLSLEEPDFEPYEAPGLDIRVVKSGRRVQLEPRALRVVGVVPASGKRVVGAQGRVDLSLGSSRFILLRKYKKSKSKTNWFLVPLEGEMLELDEETFLAAFAELID